MKNIPFRIHAEIFTPGIPGQDNFSVLTGSRLIEHYGARGGFQWKDMLIKN